MDAIADIGSNSSLDGATRLVSYRNCLHSQITAQSQFMLAYGWGGGFDGIVIHQVRKRLQLYLEGKKLDYFFQALMESIQWQMTTKCQFHTPRSKTSRTFEHT
ncbi:hypothetical protein BO78DRAFT_421938 [Aspergillus sclerotiicarbonarius CBS 121057]|uniref:Uncharacterized protein n=1 Tax=Aspergillus sclerotiicarbonarius (strain CBS 121057 / IBT 28362) TaxID=1448318 RepID=A0A319E8Z5_ASPSB|nr:hypothetical protein BO78DRAFT_421938 [Aspergillus sclerotiicarbonarius CBS 121057]